MKQKLAVLLEAKVHVNLTWIPGHTDIKSNERADLTAKQNIQLLPLISYILTTDLLFHIKYVHKEYWSTLLTSTTNLYNPVFPCYHGFIMSKCWYEYLGASSPQYIFCILATTTFFHRFLRCILF